MKKIIFIIIVITFGIQYAKCNEMIITEPEKIVVSVCDIARNSGVFLVEIKNKDIKRSLRYISTNNFCWTVKHITDIDSCTQKYLRKSIHDFYVLKKKKYKYYRKVKYPEDNCPGGPYIKIISLLSTKIF